MDEAKIRSAILPIRVVNYIRTLFGPKRLSSSYPELPLINDRFESNIKNLFIIGDLSGTALIKITMNQGFDLANQLQNQLDSTSRNRIPKSAYEVLIIGGGCSGLAAIRQLNKLGVRCL